MIAISKDIETFDWNDSTFKLSFWNWFDNLSTKDKETFWIYPVDAAELYFYNKIYNKGVSLSIKPNIR